jgi:hypothetical protein
MEDDVTLVDVSGGASGSVVVEEPDSHGGTIAHITAVDLTYDTVSPSVLLSGFTAHNHLGEAIVGTATGTGTAIAVTEELDENGGTIRHITGVNISDTTAVASDVASGKYFYTADGTKTAGSATTGGTYQAKTNISPSTSSQTITPDSGYDALSSVQINAMPSLTLPTSASSSATSGYASKATISRSTSDQYINIGTVYNAAGAYYKVNAVANGSATAPASISGTSATVSTGTNTLTLTKTVSVTPSVTAGYVSSGTARNSSVSLTASVATQAAQTIHPSTTDQSIAASRYLTGAQTIKAVTHNLDATKILSGTTFKIGDSTDDDCVTSVAGSVTFQTIYSGSSAPSSSTGVNGDIYIQT